MEERKHKYLNIVCVYMNKHIPNKIWQTYISIVSFVFATGLMTLAGIYNNFPLLLILNFLYSQQTLYQVFFFFLETHTFILERSVLFAILRGWGCCGFPLIVIKRHGSNKRCSKTSLALQMESSYFHCGEATQFLHWQPGQISLPNTVIHFLAYWHNGIRSPKYPGDSELPGQWNVACVPR